MGMIEVKKSLPHLQHQFEVLKRIETRAEFQSQRSSALGLVAGTILYFCLLGFTEANTGVGAKAIASVLLGIAWVVALVKWGRLGLNIAKRNAAINTLMETMMKDSQPQFLYFDSDVFRMHTHELKLELNWSYFKAYLETEQAIFLFPEGELFSAFCFSPATIGNQNFTELKRLAIEKLPPLDLDPA